jgi:hypothetical protein
VHERSHGKTGVRPAISSAAETIFVGAIGTSTTPDEVSCDSYTEQGSAPHYMVEHQDAKFNLHRGVIFANTANCLLSPKCPSPIAARSMTHWASGGAMSATVAGPSPDRTLHLVDVCPRHFSHLVPAMSCPIAQRGRRV